MLSFLRTLFDQLRDIWLRLGSGQKLTLSAVTITTLCAIGGVVFWAGMPNFVPLYTRLSPQEAVGIQNALEAENVPYRLDGQTLKVPARERAEVGRLLVSKGVGPTSRYADYSLLDERDFGITETELRVKLKQVQEGRLAKQISEMAQVRSATVNLTGLDETPFFEKDRILPSASIVVDLEQPLAPAQVDGIKYLVSGAVERLRPERISIVDTAGHTLAAIQDDLAGAAALASQYLSYKTAYEARLIAALEKVLEPFGNHRVTVNVEPLMDKVTETKSEIDPDKQAVTEEGKTKETVSEQEQPSEGITGVTANVPGAAQAKSVMSRSTSTTETTSKYSYPVTETTIIKSTGAPKSIFVAAVIEGKYETDGSSANVKYVPPADEQKQVIRNLIANTVGANAEAATTNIVVADTMFDKSAREAAMKALDESAKSAHQEEYLRYASGALWLVAGLVALFFLRRIIIQLSKPSEMPVKLPERELSEIEQRRALVAEEINKLSREQPASFAQLIKSWLLEE